MVSANIPVTPGVKAQQGLLARGQRRGEGLTVTLGGDWDVSPCDTHVPVVRGELPGVCGATGGTNSGLVGLTSSSRLCRENKANRVPQARLGHQDQW